MDSTNSRNSNCNSLADFTCLWVKEEFRPKIAYQVKPIIELWAVRASLDMSGKTGQVTVLCVKVWTRQPSFQYMTVTGVDNYNSETDMLVDDPTESIMIL